jgi:hypothetical protein
MKAIIQSGRIALASAALLVAGSAHAGVDTFVKIAQGKYKGKVVFTISGSVATMDMEIELRPKGDDHWAIRYTEAGISSGEMDYQLVGDTLVQTTVMNPQPLPSGSPSPSASPEPSPTPSAQVATGKILKSGLFGYTLELTEPSLGKRIEKLKLKGVGHLQLDIKYEGNGFSGEVVGDFRK